tara:strand:+ start:557 stop:1426 length:870 start_codon:yes stop_codon:yes gene_type:complete
MTEDITPPSNIMEEPEPVDLTPNTQQPRSGEDANRKAGFVIPRDFVPLPSQGRVYPVTSALYNKTEIEVRYLTAADEDILTSRSLLRSGKALDYLLDNCLIDKSIKTSELISGDKNAILTFLRVTGYGAEYKTEIDCPSCATQLKHAFDLSKLDMKTLDIDPVIEGENKFIFKTPTGTDLEFKFLNSEEDKVISDAQEKIKKITNSPLDTNVTTRLKTQIVSVNGSSDGGYIADYVDAMPVRDSRALRTYIEEHDPDLIMKQDYSCSHCGYEGEVEIPISISFFWPDTE